VFTNTLSRYCVRVNVFLAEVILGEKSMAWEVVDNPDAVKVASVHVVA